MIPGNGKVEMHEAQAFNLVIRWIPELAQVQVSWPQLDDVAKLGMLEMAKQVLSENRAESMAVRAGKSGLVIPEIKH